LKRGQPFGSHFMTIAAPFVSRIMEIEKDWIDYNGHLNMAYYNVLFDRASDEAFEIMGLGPSYAKERQLTIYTAEVHVCYVQELHLGDTVTVTFHLLDHDQKRLRAYQEIRHTDGWLAATSESLSLHIDMSGPKVAPFPPDIEAKVKAMRAAHAGLPMPERAGRSIGIQRKAMAG
jgi:acyl-CoA thioester hydrolase